MSCWRFHRLRNHAHHHHCCRSSRTAHIIPSRLLDIVVVIFINRVGGHSLLIFRSRISSTMQHQNPFELTKPLHYLSLLPLTNTLVILSYSRLSVLVLYKITATAGPQVRSLYPQQQILRLCPNASTSEITTLSQNEISPRQN